MSLGAVEWSLLLACLLGVAELMTGALVFLGMALSMLIVALTQWIWGDGQLNRDWLVFAVCSVVMVYVLRRVFRRPRDVAQDEAEHDVNQY